MSFVLGCRNLLSGALSQIDGSCMRSCVACATQQPVFHAAVRIACARDVQSACVAAVSAPRCSK
jgi:hypothetical protein